MNAWFMTKNIASTHASTDSQRHICSTAHQILFITFSLTVLMNQNGTSINILMNKYECTLPPKISITKCWLDYIQYIWCLNQFSVYSPDKRKAIKKNSWNKKQMAKTKKTLMKKRKIPKWKQSNKFTYLIFSWLIDE